MKTKVTDVAGERPMAAEDIADAYADQADVYDRVGRLERLLTGRYRRRQFGDVDGRVLDVACGTGPNFHVLDDDVDLVAVDLSPEMLSKARATLGALALDGTLHEMDAQELAFDDDSFDAVISALSTCTFPDPVAALQEMERVCAPGGEIRLLEHGRSSVGPIARFQEWRSDAHYGHAGCRWTQEPLAVAERAGLDVVASRSAWAGMLTAITARAPE